MNKEYKKGFLEAIDAILEILKNSERDLDESFIYEIRTLENLVLKLKNEFFEKYYDKEIFIKKEDILRYCEGNGVTIEEYKQEIINLLKEFPPTLMTEEEFLNSQIIEKKQPDDTLENSVEMARLR